MMTPVGLTAAETAASVRAGTARFCPIDARDKQFDPFTIAEVPPDALPPLAEAADVTGLTARERRLLRLATMPLREAASPLVGLSEKPGLCLALPETETAIPLDRQAFAGRLDRQVPGLFNPASVDASHVGRAGGLIAVGQAVLTIHGGADFMLAGGVDTYCDLYVLATLDRDERIKSDANRDGFIPGEGAAFLLLASARAAAARGLPALARLSPAALGFEPGHLESSEPYRGDGLAAALGQLVSGGMVESPVGEIYSSINGESHWSKEWGVGYLRNRAAFSPEYRMQHPAESFGDVGAACGPLMVGLAALGMRGRYRQSPALVYGSSDRGPRAAVVVSTPHH
jgi:3-oxoacyl-[acyl-carrier-protein] synthase-1